MFFRLGPWSLDFLISWKLPGAVDTMNISWLGCSIAAPQHIDMHEISMQLTIKKEMEDTSWCIGTMYKIVTPGTAESIHLWMLIDLSLPVDFGSCA